MKLCDSCPNNVESYVEEVTIGYCRSEPALDCDREGDYSRLVIRGTVSRQTLDENSIDTIKEDDCVCT